jgi:hypothetical protein
MRFVRGLNARYDLPRQVQMQVQMSGAGTVENRWGASRPPRKGKAHGALAVTEIEIRPESDGALR